MLKPGRSSPSTHAKRSKSSISSSEARVSKAGIRSLAATPTYVGHSCPCASSKYCYAAADVLAFHHRGDVDDSAGCRPRRRAHPHPRAQPQARARCSCGPRPRHQLRRGIALDIPYVTGLGIASPPPDTPAVAQWPQRPLFTLIKLSSARSFRRSTCGRARTRRRRRSRWKDGTSCSSRTR